jgi:hypothetical protein
LEQARSISGIVTDSHGTPVGGVTVEGWKPTDIWLPSFSTVTAADGSYTLTNLTAGNYAVRFNPSSGSGLLGEFYDNASQRSTATPVTVTTGPVTGISASLTGVAVVPSISGTVTASGSPVADVQVLVYAPGAWLPSYTAVTSPSGTYSVTGLNPGSYQVLFVPPTGSGLSSKWYNDAATRLASTTVVVNGGPVTNIDAHL